MKTSLIAALLLSTAAFLRADTTSPPVLPLAKAAAIAQTTLDGLKLPPENFLRYISYQPVSDRNPVAFYRVAFEPVISRKLVGSPSALAKIKYIKVLMDGTASVVEEELPERRMVRPAQEKK